MKTTKTTKTTKTEDAYSDVLEALQNLDEALGELNALSPITGDLLRIREIIANFGE